MTSTEKRGIDGTYQEQGHHEAQILDGVSGCNGELSAQADAPDVALEFMDEYADVFEELAGQR